MLTVVRMLTMPLVHMLTMLDDTHSEHTAHAPVPNKKGHSAMTVVLLVLVVLSRQRKQ